MASCLSQDGCASWHLWRTRGWTLEKAHSESKQFNGPWEMSHWNQDKLCTQNQDKLPLGDRGDSTPTSTTSTVQSTAAFPCSDTHQYWDPWAGGWTGSPHQTLEYLGESSIGAQLGCNLVNITQESKITKCGCQNCTIAALARETTPQCDHLPLNTLDTTEIVWIKSTLCTPQLHSGIHFTASWHGRQQTVTNTKHTVVMLGTVFPKPLNCFSST